MRWLRGRSLMKDLASVEDTMQAPACYRPLSGGGAACGLLHRSSGSSCTVALPPGGLGFFLWPADNLACRDMDFPS
jgi:hypothetical protein